MTLSARTNAEIENAFRDGLTLRAAAVRCDVGKATISLRYMALRKAGTPRACKPRQIKCGNRFSDIGWPPPYTGPVWIGLPAV